MCNNVDWLQDVTVAVVKDRPVYLQDPPYHPSEIYPEVVGRDISPTDNPAYRSVRRLFAALGCDKERFGKPDWNPLVGLISPGCTVILKPNLVADRNHGEEAFGISDTDCLVTHGSVIRAVLDYVGLALQNHGRVIIADCPIQGTNWPNLLRLIGFEPVKDCFNRTFPGIDLEIQDYRLGRATMVDGHVVERVVDESQRSEYVEVDLAEHSLLIPLMQDGKYAFGVSQYPRHRMVTAHTPTVNKYLIHRQFLEADVMINLPKMKSHMKAGITCALKNFVGINGHKDYLPHFRFGGPKQGGDEYPDGSPIWDLMWWVYHREWEMDAGLLKRLLIRIGRFLGLLDQLIYRRPKGGTMLGGGGWYGNDTLWRTVLDINRAYFYFDPRTRKITESPRPKKGYLAILDGLVGGQRESPLSPTPIASGLMMAARNPVALDTVAAAMMGLDYRLVKQISQAYSPMPLSLVSFSPDEIQIVGGDIPCSLSEIYNKQVFCRFEPSRGYRGKVEYLP